MHKCIHMHIYTHIHIYTYYWIYKDSLRISNKSANWELLMKNAQYKGKSNQELKILNNLRKPGVEWDWSRKYVKVRWKKIMLVKTVNFGGGNSYTLFMRNGRKMCVWSWEGNRKVEVCIPEHLVQNLVKTCAR